MSERAAAVSSSRRSLSVGNDRYAARRVRPTGIKVHRGCARAALFLSEATVKTHINHIFGKTGLRDRGSWSGTRSGTALPHRTELNPWSDLRRSADSTSAPMPARMPRPSFQSWKQHDSTPGYTRRQRRRFPVPAAPQSATAGKRSASSPWPRSTWAPPSTSGRRSRRCRPPAVPCPWTTSKAAPARRATCPPRGRRGR